MKRLSMRLSIVGVMLASGILAIAQAQRGDKTTPPEAGLAAPGGETTPEPRRLVANPTAPRPIRDPEREPEREPYRQPPLAPYDAAASGGPPQVSIQDVASAGRPPSGYGEAELPVDPQLGVYPANSPGSGDPGALPADRGAPVVGAFEVGRGGGVSTSLADNSLPDNSLPPLPDNSLPDNSLPDNSLAGQLPANGLRSGGMNSAPRGVSAPNSELGLPPDPTASPDAPSQDLAARFSPQQGDPQYADPQGADPQNADPQYADPQNADPQYAAADPQSNLQNRDPQQFAGPHSDPQQAGLPYSSSQQAPQGAASMAGGPLAGGSPPIDTLTPQIPDMAATAVPPYGSPDSRVLAASAGESAGPGDVGEAAVGGVSQRSLPAYPAQNSYAGAAAAPGGGGVAPGAADASASMPSARPGDRESEGVRTPSVAIEKRAPREIRVGQKTVFELLVRNVGAVAAHNVTVLDRVPQGTELVETTPAARNSEGMLIWELGTLEPGEEQVVSIHLIPRTEGEIGSVAQVVLHSQAAVRTVCTKPQLTIKQTAPESVLIGQEARILIQIANPGTGAADNVVLEADVPPGLSHPRGTALKNVIGTLQPGETRDIQLVLTASQAGLSQSVVRAVSAEGDLKSEHVARIEVVAPQLAMQITGPAIRYLSREATYQVTVANPGTATARAIETVLSLPEGMQFVSATHEGRYQQQNHTIFWRLEELPAGQQDSVELTVLPIRVGGQKIRADGRATLGLAASAEHATNVESLNELEYKVTDLANPIEVGAETVYEIKVTNKGSRADSEVVVAMQFPEGMEPLEANGPTQFQIQGQSLVFAPLGQLNPQGEAVFRVKARGHRDGFHRVRVQLQSRESPAPVMSEVVTRVYEDRVAQQP